MLPATSNVLLVKELLTTVPLACMDQSQSTVLVQSAVVRMSSVSKDSVLPALRVAMDASSALKTAFSVLPDT